MAFKIPSIPFDNQYLLRKKKAIRRELMKSNDFLNIRIAILGGSTTAEVKDMLELFMLAEGFKAEFYESDYNRFYEEILFQNDNLKSFSPEIIYIHTSNVNITRYPLFTDNAVDIDKYIEVEIDRFRKLWDRIDDDYSCPVIQNNFELPHYRVLGNLDCYDIHGRTQFISSLNNVFNLEARQRSNLYLNDINYLSAWFGLELWYDKLFWYSYKYAMNIEAIPLVAHSVTSIIKAIFGKSKKCLVLDLDNTIWGGVIGDDGINGIKLGNGTPESEAYTEFQQYLKTLKNRGVILAVCSKNEEKNAIEGLNHCDSLLKPDDFSVIKANWRPKHENIREIARQLNIGIDSLVFIDDNPAERDIVRYQETEVTVPELGDNVVKYINIIDKSGAFEPISITRDDFIRNKFYTDNVVRKNDIKNYEHYDDFLKSLRMVAEIKRIPPLYLERATQLTNKTNQFNVTTKRYNLSEFQEILQDDRYIALYGRLRDKYGDNGLVTILVGLIQQNELHIDLWLMSCRVLKRGLEMAMFDQLVIHAQEKQVVTIIGYYYPTAKNDMVSGLFRDLGFKNITNSGNVYTQWKFEISNDLSNKNTVIEIDND
jgi:FkbH-like protein